MIFSIDVIKKRKSRISIGLFTTLILLTFGSAYLSRLSHHLGVISVWAWFLIPGTILTLFFRRRLYWFERIPLAFGLSIGFYTPFTVLAILMRFSLRAFLIEFFCASLVLIVIYFLWGPESYQPVPKTSSSRKAQTGLIILICIALAVTLTLIYLSLIWPPAGDDLAGLPLYEEVLSKGGITGREPFHGTGTPVTPRNELVVWGYQTTLLAHLGKIAPRILLVDSRAVLILISMLSVYLFSSRWFQSKKFGLSFVIVWGTYLLTTLQFDGDGNYFVTRMFQDKFMAWFLIIPSLLVLYLWYIEEGQSVYLILFGLGAFGVGLLHPVTFMILLIITAAYALIHLLFERTRSDFLKFFWIGLLLVFCLAFPVVQYIRYMGPMPLEIAGLDTALDFSRYTMALGRYRLFLLNSGRYIVHPSLILQPVTIAGLFLSLLLIKDARTQKGSRLLLGSLLLITLLLYLPITVYLLGKFATPYLLWRLAWPYPFLSLLVLLTVIHKVSDLALARLKQNHFFQQARNYQELLIVLIVILVSLPAIRNSLVSFREKLNEVKYSTCYQAMDVLTHIHDQAPGEEINILASPRLNLCIPGTIGLANVVEYRGLGTVNRLPAEQISESLQRIEDAEYYSHAIAVDFRLVRMLNEYEIDVIVVENERLEFEHQFRLIPEWFEPLYADQHFSAYRVHIDGEPSSVIIGNESLRMRLWSEAQDHFLVALNADANNVLAHLGLARALVGQGKIEEAIEHALEAARLQPDEPAVHIRLANLYLSALDLEEAARQYQVAAQFAPEQGEVSLLLANVQYILGDEELAYRNFEEGVAEYSLPGSAAFYTELGKELAYAGWIEEAERNFQEAINISPTSKLYVDYGEALLKAGDIEQAASAAQRAIDLDPWFFQAYQLLGKTYQDRMDYEQAILTYKKAIKFNPADMSVYLDLAKTLQEQLGVERAISELDQIAESLPLLPGPHAGLLRLYIMKGDSGKAFNEYDLLVSYMPRQESMNVLQGYLLIQSGYYERAFLELGEVLQENPTMIPASVGLAKLYSSLGNVDQEYGERYLITEQTSLTSWPYLMLARTNFKNGQWVQAQEEISFGIKVNTSRASSYQMLGDFYFHQARWDEALDAYLTAHDLDSINIDTINKIGMCYWRKGELDIARRYYQESLKIDPESVETNITLAEIEWWEGNEEASLGIVDDIINRGQENISDLGLIYNMLVLQGRAEEIESLSDYIIASLSSLVTEFPEWFDGEMTAQENIGRSITLLDPGEEEFGSISRLLDQIVRFYLSQGENKKAIDIAQLNIDITPNSPIGYISLADTRLVNGSNQSAVEVVQKGLEVIPDSPELLSWLGNFHVDHGDIDLGKKLLSDTVNRFPEYLPAVIDLAELLTLIGDLTLAEDLLSSYWEREPRNSLVLPSLISVFRFQGNAQKIDESLMQGLERFPTNISLILEAGLFQQQSGNFTDAEKLFHQALNLDPLDHRSRIALGDLYLDQELVEDSLKIYQEAAVVDRGSLAPILSIADLYQILGDHDRAMKVLESSHLLFPGEPTLYNHLGNLLFASSQLENALAWYAKACDVDNQNSDCLLGQGLVYIQKGLLEEAEIVIERSINISPSDLDGYLALAEVYRYTNRVMEIEALLEGMIDSSINKASAHAVMAAFNTQMGNFEEAEADFLQASKIWPGSSRLPIELAKFYKLQNNPGKAFEVLEEAIELFGLTCESGLEMGDIYLRQADWQTAQEYFQKLIHTDPQCPQAYLGRAKSYEEMGDLDSAMDIYSTAIATFPEEAIVHAALGDFYFHLGDYINAESAYHRAIELSPDTLKAILGIEQISAKNEAADLEFRLDMGSDSLDKPDLLSRYAIKIQEQGRWDESEEYIQQALSLDPFHSQSWLAYGNKVLHDLDYDEAEKAFNSAINYSGFEVTGLLALGNLYVELEKYDLAEDVYREALSLKPSEVEGYIALASLYYSTGQVESAKLLLQTGIKDIPSASELYEALARIYLGEDEIGLGINIASEGLEKIPGASDLHTALGDLYSREYFDYKKKVDESNASSWWYLYIIDRIKSKPNYPNRVASERIEELQRWYQLAISELSLSQKALASISYKFDLARTSYYQALELDKNSERAWLGLAQLDILIGNFESGVEHYQKALNANPDSIIVLNTFGFTYLALGEPDRALSLFAHSLEIAPDQELAQLGRFRALLDRKAWDVVESGYITEASQFWWDNIVVHLRELNQVELGEVSVRTEQQAISLGRNMQINVPGDWSTIESYQDSSYIRTHISPDDQALMQLVVYNDGNVITRKIASIFALALIRETYGEGLVVTDDQVQNDRENLTWKSELYHYQGVTGFTINEGSIVLFTYIYDNRYQDVYLPKLDEAANQIILGNPIFSSGQ